MKKLVLNLFFVSILFFVFHLLCWSSSHDFDETIPDNRKLLIYEKMIRVLQKENSANSCKNLSNYCRRPETVHINCEKALQGDKSYTNSIIGINRVPLIQNPSLNMSCSEIHKRIVPRHHMPSMNGIAFARTVRRDYEFVEKTVQMSWHPRNRFCFVMDEGAKEEFKKKMRKLVGCFEEQMILMEDLPLDSAGHNQNLAHYNCMEALLKHLKWSYLMLLQNHDIITKTVYELDQIFGILNGTNDVMAGKELGERRKDGHKWDPRSLTLFRNESKIPAKVLNEPLKIASGGIEASISRDAVKWLVEIVNVSKFLEQQNEIKYGADEQFFSTLQLNSQLGMPGHFTTECMDQNVQIAQITRMAQFAYNHPEKCASGTVRHNACLFGIEDFRAMIELPYLVWNKVYPSFDWSVIECTAELIYNRTFLGRTEPELDQEYYKNLITVDVEIPNAVNGRLGEIETTKYLSHRATFSTDLKISATCEVTVNISESTVDNFFLMFVRDPEPPLFFRRFTKSTDKQTLVPLTDLQCLKDGDQYSWFHDSVKIADSFEVTLMSDEECGCEEILESEIAVEKIDGTCDAFNLECASNTPTLFDSLGFTVISPLETETTVAETTCVNHSWYYNGYKFDSPTFTCFTIPLEDPPTILKKPEMKSFVARCPCTYFLQTINATDEYKQGPAWPSYVEKYHISETYQQMNSVQGIPDIDESTCRVSLSCPDNKKLVVWSLNNEPMIFSSDESAVLQCASLPASSILSGKSVKDWWINGLLALNIVYTCYE